MIKFVYGLFKFIKNLISNLENDLKIILNKIGIYKIIHQPFRKNSKSHNNYKTYYNNDILHKVNLIMKEDFEHFDYTKIDNINDF